MAGEPPGTRCATGDEMEKAKTIFSGDHIVVLARDGWEYVERKSASEAVAVVATNDKDELILTEQHRAPVNARVIDWPAGLVGDEGSKDPGEAALRELEEETGHTADQVERLARGPSSPGIVSEIITFYRARAKKSGSGGGVGGERITVHTVPRASIREWLKMRELEGLLVDAKIWAGLYFLENE